MDERIEGIARMGSDLFADYVTGVVEAAEKLVDNVVANAAVLARDVVRDGAAVVEAALEGLLDEEAIEEDHEAEARPTTTD